MNFIHTFETGEVAVAWELKYCERCGGLWIRRQGQDVVYCGGCRDRMKALLGTRRRRACEPRMAKKQAQIECLRGVAEMEVRP
jgi:3-deoxy-D-arabino-heptulosonate 7-phosphate (DAHP) synthase class II